MAQRGECGGGLSVVNSAYIGQVGMCSVRPRLFPHSPQCHVTACPPATVLSLLERLGHCKVLTCGGGEGTVSTRASLLTSAFFRARNEERAYTRTHTLSLTVHALCYHAPLLLPVAGGVDPALR